VFTLYVKPGLEVALVELRHAEAIFDAIDRQREYLREWLPWVDQTTTIGHVEEFIHKALRKFADQDGFDAGVWLDGHYIGGIGMHYWDRVNWKTEIGYWLSHDFTGQGLMTECVRRCVHFAFRELGMRRIEIRCAVPNRKSRAIPERLAFTLEGMLRGAYFLHGSWIDMAVYGLLNSDQPSTSSAA
jgi:ribosomal-protein-serine acetyltransferase